MIEAPHRPYMKLRQQQQQVELSCRSTRDESVTVKWVTLYYNIFSFVSHESKQACLATPFVVHCLSSILHATLSEKNLQKIIHDHVYVYEIMMMHTSGSRGSRNNKLKWDTMKSRERTSWKRSKKNVSLHFVHFGSKHFLSDVFSPCARSERA